jgi:hypothetical protein
MLEFPAFEIVTGPLLKNADPYAKDEVRKEKTEEKSEYDEED